MKTYEVVYLQKEKIYLEAEDKFEAKARLDEMKSNGVEILSWGESK